jgi:hypothetical protein
VITSRIKLFWKHQSSGNELTPQEIKFKHFLQSKDCLSLKKLKKRTILTRNEMIILNEYLSMSGNENFCQYCQFLTTREESFLKHYQINVNN